MGYSLQANRKSKEGPQHANRDAQFRYINRRVKASLGTGVRARVGRLAEATHLPVVQVPPRTSLKHSLDFGRDPPDGVPDGNNELQNRLRRKFGGSQKWPYLPDSIGRGGQI